MKALKLLLASFLILSINSFAQDWDNSTASVTSLAEYEDNALYILIIDGQTLGDNDIRSSNNSLLTGFPILSQLFNSGQLLRISQEFKILANQSKEFSRLYRLSFADGTVLTDIMSDLSTSSQYEFSERIPVYKTSVVPNDPDYNTVTKRWHLDHVDAENAWDISTGCQSISIAIVDDAVLTNHQDLQSNLYVNPGEIANNGIDDDNNGYVDDVNGYDVADNDNDANPPTSASNTYFTHGTHVAGIAAGTTNNGIGMAAMGFNSTIVPVKTKSNSNGSPSTLNNPMQGVEYAIAAEVDVINMSWGSYASSTAHQMVFNLAQSNGIVCVAAAGNDGQSFIAFPADYNHVISVGALNTTGDLAPYTNLSTTIDIFAPGSNIWSPLAGSNTSYGFLSGTSMASPLVSGLAALMLCNNGGFYDVQNCIHNSADIYLSTVFTNYSIKSANAQQSLLCSPPTVLSCESSGCELIYNGGFEIPNNSNITAYSGWHGIANGHVCSWETYYGSADCFPLTVANTNNYAHILVDGVNGGYEGLVSNTLGITSGQQYTLEFDYAVSCSQNSANAGPITELKIGLINNQYNWTLQNQNTSTSIIPITSMYNLPVDFTYTQYVELHNGTATPDASFHHVTYTFTAPANITNNQRLVIYPQISYAARREVELDNLSLRPVINVTAMASSLTVGAGGCVNLGAIGSGTTYIWEPADEFANPIGANQSVCPDSTITYIVTAYDSITGCTSSDSITIEVSGTNNILDHQLLQDLSIYPNPTNSAVNVFSEHLTTSAPIVIYNMLGEVIFESTLIPNTVKTINLDRFANGFYILKIEGHKPRRILKQ